MSNALVPEFAVSDFAASKRFSCRHLGCACVYERPEDGFAYLALGKAELMIDQIGRAVSFLHELARVVWNGGMQVPPSQRVGAFLPRIFEARPS